MKNGLSCSEQRTVSKTQNNRLTGKAPYKSSANLIIGTGLLSLGGDNAALGERADELVAITTEHGFPAWHAQGTVYRGYAKVKNGDVVKGISLLRSVLSAYRATGTETWIPHHIALMAWACEIAGQIEEAVTLLDDALQIVERTGERWLATELYRHKASCCCAKVSLAVRVQSFLTVAAINSSSGWPAILRTTPESQVRLGLAAGGKEIRTVSLSPSRCRTSRRLTPPLFDTSWTNFHRW